MMIRIFKMMSVAVLTFFEMAASIRIDVNKLDQIAKFIPCILKIHCFDRIIREKNVIFFNIICFYLQGYGWEHTLSKWSQLNYASHWVALITFVFYWLIK